MSTSTPLPRITLLGRKFAPREVSEAAEAAGKAARLMKSPEYLNKADPLHEATVAEVNHLMHVVHPNPTDLRGGAVMLQEDN